MHSTQSIFCWLNRKQRYLFYVSRIWLKPFDRSILSPREKICSGSLINKGFQSMVKGCVLKTCLNCNFYMLNYARNEQNNGHKKSNVSRETLLFHFCTWCFYIVRIALKTNLTKCVNNEALFFSSWRSFC